MSVLIIYAHPYDKSFNHAVLETVLQSLDISKVKYNVIDLYGDGFNPAYSTEELALFSVGKTLDDLVIKYQQLIKASSKVIFIFPVWWNDTPAIVKGFIDKIMKKSFSYYVGKTGVVGKLNNINKTLILTTSTSPTFYLNLFCGNAIKGVFVKSTLKQLNFRHLKWKNFGSIDTSSKTRRTDYLNNLSHYIKKWSK